jgi:signal transduction histidine kinase
MLAPGRDARVVYANRALAEQLGRALADLLGQSLPEVLRELSASADLVAELDAGVAARVDSSLPGGAEITTLEWSLSPVKEADGRVSQWLGLVRDVSVLRASTERERDGERLKAVAQVVAGMAHEINNPLASVTSNLEWLAATLPKLRPLPQTGALAQQQTMSSVSAALVDALAGAERIETTLANLTLLLGVEYAQREIADVRLLLEGALHEIGPLLPENVSVVREYAEVPPVFIGERRLNQAFIALLANAIQAMATDEGQHRLVVRTSFAERVRIEIEDDGEGIDPSVAPRLFRPFVTTRPPGAGKGLGLYLTKNIVEAAGGSIGFHPREAGGTVFFIELPPADELRA